MVPAHPVDRTMQQTGKHRIRKKQKNLGKTKTTENNIKRLLAGPPNPQDLWKICFFKIFFPTCQVRVARFYVGGAAHLPDLLPSSSPDLICQLLIAESLARSHLPALDGNGPRRTLSASSPDVICQLSIAVGHAGLQPSRVGALWALPDFNRRDSARCGPRRTSTGEGRSAVGLAGLQPARV